MRLSEKTILYLLRALNALLVLLFIMPVAELPPIFAFFGRLHPLLLHFPIVMLLVALLFEVLAYRGKEEFKSAAKLLLWAGAFTAVVTAIAGHLLSVNGDYAGASFTFHKWFGLATSLIVLLLIELQQQLKTPVLSVYILLAILLVITGHYGASLTHGDDFLTAVFESDQEMSLDPEQPVFSEVVLPILENKCTSCHNENKLKGGLLLNSREGILKGGESGSILMPGDISNSKLISHTLLPMEDKLHMPPKGKSQLTNEEVKMLSWWVENEASFESKVSDIDSSDPIQVVFASYFVPEASIDIDFASNEVLEDLNKDGLNIKQMEVDKPYLEVYLGQEPDLNVDKIRKLRSVKEQIHTLDLGNSRIDKRILKEVARFKNLQRLYLDNTATDDAMVSALRKLKKLEYLNLYGTQVSRKGATLATEISALKQLFLWQTQLSGEDLSSLQASHPDVEINGGLAEDSEFTTAQLAPPTMNYTSTFFSEEISVEVNYNLSDTELFFQIDSGEPQPLESGVVKLSESGKLTVFAQKEGWEDSPPVEQVFIRTSDYGLKAMKLAHAAKGAYKANGVSTLFDLKKGSENFRDGHWLGFNGDDLVVDIELKKSQQLKAVYVSTIDDIGSWIFPPTNLEVWGGTEKGKMVKLKELTITPPEGPEPKHMIIHQLDFDLQSLKHIRIRAKNYGDLPEWHPGKDTPAWLFIDEIAFN